jgi:fumarylacetoacetate (FAA) hydrolase family protein
MLNFLTVSNALPFDFRRATLIGRVWVEGKGPVLVQIRDNGIYDLSGIANTCSQLLQLPDPASAVRKGAAGQPAMFSTAVVLANSAQENRDKAVPWFMAPCDLQAIKAAGVTFVASMLERVIEEQARGDAAKAEAIRRDVVAVIGEDLSHVIPGSPQAAKLKDALIAQGVWSQYLEVGIGPDAEIFTKSQVMSAVGIGAEVGIHPRSVWNNPEPEVVLAVNSFGQVKGVALGNDVNLRDFEGRSALLLGKAKDNNASCAIGPFIRLFDENFRLEDVRELTLSLDITGDEGSDEHAEPSEPFTLHAVSDMRKISRDPLDLVRQTINDNHQYPDGFMLFLGTMFSPTQDRLGPGTGFTHMAGDVVRISTPQLGCLVNRVNRSDKIPPWSYGIRALMRDLALRGGAL